MALKHLNQLSGSVVYYPKKIEHGNPKNFKKKLKQRQLILEYISDNTDYYVNWEEFIDNIITTNKDPTTGTEPYPNGISIPENVGHNLTFYDILSTYFNFKFLEEQKKPGKMVNKILESSSFQEWFEKIKKSYYPNSVPLTLEEVRITVDYLAADKNRKIAMDLLSVHLQKEFTHQEISVILKYYLWRNKDLTLKKMEHLFPTHLLESVSHLNEVDKSKMSWKSFSDQEIRFLYKYFSELTKKNLGIREVHDSDSEDSLEEELEDRYEFYRDQINQASRFYLCDLPVWSDFDGRTVLSPESCYSEDKIYISNINTLFRINFTLDKLLLKNVLISKYGERDIFKEDTYGGMKVVFLTNIDCPVHKDLDRRTELKNIEITPEYGGCMCKDVSILVFPNVTLITGGRSFRQILHAYHFIKNVYLSDFVEILSGTSSYNSPLDKYPNIVSTDKHIFLKKKFVLDNPRNQFILSKTKLIDVFSKIDQEDLFN